MLCFVSVTYTLMLLFKMVFSTLGYMYRFLNDNFPLSPPFYVRIFPSDTQTKMELWGTGPEFQNDVSE